MNIQFAVQGTTVFVLEVNPRASRTVPFVSKAIGVPLAKLAARVMVGRKLRDLGFRAEVLPKHISVKEAVFPFNKFPGVDTLLGPEMKSTGEVMGIDVSFGLAFAKAQLGGGMRLPSSGKVFISVNEDKALVDRSCRETSPGGVSNRSDPRDGCPFCRAGNSCGNRQQSPRRQSAHSG